MSLLLILALLQVGGSARKTNSDYTKGKLPELIDIICKSGAKLFVSAVGVPPKFAVDKLHEAGILVMNMVGAVKHIPKALGTLTLSPAFDSCQPPVLI